MAFGVVATSLTTSVNLMSGPYTLISAKGMAGVFSRRITKQGAAQDGDSDSGYRLNPRELELVIGISAATDALGDTYRDALTSLFKPLPSTPINLTVTRDDAAIRQLDCNVVGNIKVSLVPQNRPGHYQVMTVRLRAPDPAYYNPTQGSVTVLGTSLVAAQWWLGGGAVGSARVVEHGSVPTQGQVWTYAGTPSGEDGYTIVIRSARETLTDGKYAFFAGAGGGSPAISFSTYGTTSYKVSATYPDGGVDAGSAAMPVAGTHNYFFDWTTNGITIGTSPVVFSRFDGYRDDSDTLFAAVNDISYNLSGTARRWRSDATNSVASRWSNAIEKYAVYVPKLGYPEKNAVSEFMSLTDSTTNAQVLPIAYNGNLPDYPTIAITGPVTNPSVTNLTTGETLDFGTITIGGGVTYLINTHPLYKTVLVGTVSHRGELTEDSDLGDFHLAPNPDAPGGTNVFYLNGTAMSAATRFSVAYYHRYQSY